MQKKDDTHVQHDTAEVNSRLNWIRAAVLGANDGIVSVAGLVVGVAGATTDKNTIFTAGIAGLVAGALSMAAGEYISVSSQRDTEKALIEKEIYELEHNPERELRELAHLYEEKGLSAATAKEVARELTAHDPIRAHLEAELNMNPDELTSPRDAAVASALSFTAGALLPLIAILLPSPSWRVPLTFVAVVAALVITGQVSAKFGQANKFRATVRIVIGGALAMLVTYGIGNLFDIHV
jgi:vacuolar iron transporter family protein